MRHQNKRHRKVRKYTAGPNFSGQHLLHNPRTIEALVRTPRIQPDETVLEIGAGKGAITLPLAGYAGRVIAVEVDNLLVERLRENVKSVPEVTVVHGDFRMMKLPVRPFCVVANIPFSITTLIFERLLGPEGGSFQRGAFILEKGAAIRITQPLPADPRLIAWKMNFCIEIRQNVPRTHFSPPPRVDAVIVSVERKGKPLLAAGQYRRFCAFAKFLLKNSRYPLHEPLGDIFTAAQMKKVMKEAGADRTQSAAALSVRQWSVFFQAMLQHVQPHRWPR